MKQVILVVFLLYGILIASCDNNTQKQSEFFYYPNRNVYYDVANSLYYYSLNGGKTWDSLYAKTNNQPATLGNRQIIYSTSPEIWKNNLAHINQYGGKLYNLVNSDSSNFQNDLAADRKTKKPKPAVTITEKKEKKPGFFKRLFGKKN